MAYQPVESTSEHFGGNSNWRGPIWFPVNFLIVESLQKFHRQVASAARRVIPQPTEYICRHRGLYRRGRDESRSETADTN